MYAEIILSQRFPKHMGIFDYLIPDKLSEKIALGVMVRIPFRSQFREGIVIRIKQHGIAGKHIKPIKEIIADTPALTKAQLLLADWLTAYYHVSLGTIIKTMLPPVPPKRAHARTPVPLGSHQPLDPARQQSIQKSLALGDSLKLIVPRTYDDYCALYQTVAGETGGMQLIIVPTIERIPQLASLVPRSRQNDVVIVHGLLGNNELYERWEQIRSNPNAIIIGTKSAIFLPLHSVRRIIIDGEENQNHKQSEQNPRYDVRRLAEQCRSIYHAELIFVSSAPQVGTFHTVPLSSHIELRSTQTNRNEPQVIDMRDERMRKNYSLLSETLELSITQKLSQKKKIFLLINKRGSANALMCQDCGTAVRCPTCSNAYTYHEQSEELYCHHCLSRTEVPPFCNTCHGTYLRTIGFGTQSVESFIKKKYPNARIARIDPESKTRTDLSIIDIMIGTSGSIGLAPSFRPSLIGLIDADTFLYLPDYRSVERTWQLIKSLAIYPAELVIQTHNPEHYVFQLLINSSDANFYEKELATRKSLGYPPFGSLIKLIIKNHDKKATIAEAQRLYRTLNQQPLEVSLVTPLRPFQHSYWHMYVVIRFDQETPLPVIQSVLNAIPNGWIIDRDPTSLL